MQEGICLKVQVVFQEKNDPVRVKTNIHQSAEFRAPTVADIQDCGNKGVTGWVCVSVFCEPVQPFLNLVNVSEFSRQTEWRQPGNASSSTQEGATTSNPGDSHQF